MGFIDEVALKEIVEDPPDALDVVVGERDVRMVQIDPVAHQFRHFPPQLFIAEHGIAAVGAEFLQAIFFHGAFIFQTELLFHLDLHGQAMRVPPGFTLHLIAGHGLVSADRVLEGAGHHVMDAGFAIGGGGSFKKYESGTAFPEVLTLFGQRVLVPVIAHPGFQSAGAFLEVDCFVHISYGFRLICFRILFGGIRPGWVSA